MTDRELMQMALDALKKVNDTGSDTCRYKQFDKEVKALRDRLAQPEPEPAFYVIQATDRFGEGYEQTYWEDPLGFPVYTRPVHAIDISQKRVDETAKRKHDIVGACVTCGAPWGFWLSAPPTNFIGPSVIKAISKREWVGLEEEEILKCFDSVALGQVEGACVIDKHVNIFNAIRAIEAKLKEKNGG